MWNDIKNIYIYITGVWRYPGILIGTIFFFLYESVRIFYANTKNYTSPLGLRASKQRKHSANTNPYIAVQSSLPNITRNIITSKKDPS